MMRERIMTPAEQADLVRVAGVIQRVLGYNRGEEFDEVLFGEFGCPAEGGCFAEAKTALRKFVNIYGASEWRGVEYDWEEEKDVHRHLAAIHSIAWSRFDRSIGESPKFHPRVMGDGKLVAAYEETGIGDPSLLYFPTRAWAFEAIEQIGVENWRKYIDYDF